MLDLPDSTPLYCERVLPYQIVIVMLRRNDSLILINANAPLALIPRRAIRVLGRQMS
jgi:hypothetical protein